MNLYLKGLGNFAKEFLQTSYSSVQEFLAGVAREKKRGLLESCGEDGFIKFCRSMRIVPLKLVINGQRGFPDFTLYYSTGLTIYIEMKRPKGGRISPQQKSVRLTLERQGQIVYVCRGFKEARAVVESHLTRG